MRANAATVAGIRKAGLWSAFFFAAFALCGGGASAQLLGVKIGAGHDARAIFDGVVSVDRIRVDWGGTVQTPGLDRGAKCSVLGVDLLKTASPQPPKGNLAIAPDRRFGGQWRPTPRRDLVALCGELMDLGALRLLQMALA